MYLVSFGPLVVPAYVPEKDRNEHGQIALDFISYGYIVWIYGNEQKC